MLATHTIEQRKYIRHPAEGDVIITFKSSDISYQGQLKDISNSGIFVNLDESSEGSWINANATIQIVSNTDDQTLIINGNIRIIRTTSKGVGIFINDIRRDNRANFIKLLIHVRNINNQNQQVRCYG